MFTKMRAPKINRLATMTVLAVQPGVNVPDLLTMTCPAVTFTRTLKVRPVWNRQPRESFCVHCRVRDAPPRQWDCHVFVICE
jgi:hypothetical protein